MFQFKQFNITQEKSAMKVGNDGVLLGAWTPIKKSFNRVLDIGTGTGLLALMLAQRSNAEQIDAIEIEEGAYEEAVENFENSPWNDRLFCYHAALEEFIEEAENDMEEGLPINQYDLIVSNPPFYSENYKSEILKKNLARFQDALPFEILIQAVSLLLSKNGFFVVIIPYKEEKKLTNLAKEEKLYPFQITHVKGTKTSTIKRSLIAFSRLKKTVINNELIIEISRHNYTKEFIKLTKDFYLKF